MKATIRKTSIMFLVAAALTSCSKDDERPKGTDECTYRVTLDGVATQPNQFGQDHITLGFSSDPTAGETGFGVSLMQTKANGETVPIFVFESEDVHFNSETPGGTTYIADKFDAWQPGTPEWDTQYHYEKGWYDDEEGIQTLTVAENSDQRIRLSISGTVMKRDVYNETDLGLVPVEAEFVFGRVGYTEMNSGGIFIATVSCFCEE